jgi:hypothetical protein
MIRGDGADQGHSSLPALARYDLAHWVRKIEVGTHVLP